MFVRFVGENVKKTPDFKGTLPFHSLLSLVVAICTYFVFIFDIHSSIPSFPNLSGTVSTHL